MSVVMKFGGTSVGDAAAVERLIGIVRRQIDKSGSRPPVVVVSALAGVTDKLIEVTRRAGEGDGERAVAALQLVLERHLEVAAAVTTAAQAPLIASIRAEFDELIGLVHALSVLREVSPRSYDAVVATGEMVSSRLVAAALSDHGITCAWVDARSVLVTDADHTGAAPDMEATERRAAERIRPVTQARQVAVLAGFIGATPNGVTTTLGRGGSDYSASIFGAALHAEEIQIWTDVDGMLTADPRIVRQPRLVPRLSFAEASELAYFGAKVLHPSTILPAVGKAIPVRILNSQRPDNTGTVITGDRNTTSRALTAIACKRNVTVVDITSTRMLMAFGFLRRLFEVFERFKTAVDVVTTSEVSVSVTVDDTRRLDDVVDNLRHFADVSCEREMAIISAVGENLRSDPSLFARAVTSLERIPLRLVSQAAGRRNITFVLHDADVPDAMERLHQEFFESKSVPAFGSV